MTHARITGGIHVTLAPAALLPEQVKAALNELGVEAAAVLELAVVDFGMWLGGRHSAGAGGELRRGFKFLGCGCCPHQGLRPMLAAVGAERLGRL